MTATATILPRSIGAAARNRGTEMWSTSAGGQRATQVYLLQGEYVRPGFGNFYFSPSGRISRSQYWLKFFLPVIGISIAFQIIVGIAAAVGSVVAAGIFYVLYVIFALVTLWPGIAVLVKRIHDRNKTGWLVLALYIPLALSARSPPLRRAASGADL